MKKNLDFATDADVDAERQIVEDIAETFPDHAILAEEVGWDVGGPEHRFTWLIDPLCGTLNFASGLPFFSVNIALLENDQPVLGVVAEPLANEIMWTAVVTPDAGPVHLTAGIFICQQAGCVITNANGEPWTPRCRSVLAAADASTYTLLKSFMGWSR